MPRVAMAEQVMTLAEAAARFPRLWIAGASGMGKTMALGYLAQKHSPAPVTSLIDYHPEALPRNFEGNAWILLDDAGAADRDYMAEVARAFPEARIVAAGTRVPEWEPGRLEKENTAGSLPDGFVGVELLELNDAEIYRVAEPWFPAPKAVHGDYKARNPGAHALVEAIKTHPEVRYYAARPLDLFLLLQVYVEGKPLPATRTALWDLYMRNIVTGQPDPALALAALQGIALSTKRGQPAQADHLERGAGLLMERPSGRIAFVHDQAQDFLAAQALTLNPDFSPMREHLQDPAWRQVVLFYAGLGSAREVVTTLLDQDPYLAAEAMAQWPEAPADLKAKIGQEMARRAWDENDERALVALGALRSGEATDSTAARLKDRSPAVRAQAAEMLGYLHTDKALEYLLPQLRDADGVVRQKVVQALGRSRSERVIEPLLVALRGDARVVKADLSLRVAAAEALGWIGNEKAAPALLVDLQTGEPPVREAAARALAQIRGAFSVRPLQDLAAHSPDPEVRTAAGSVLEAYQD